MDLMNYLNVLWKKNWFIIIVTYLFIATAAVISFLLPSKWEVDAILKPSKYVYQDAYGVWNEIQFIRSSGITAAINQGAYNAEIATELHLDLKDFPKLKAENLKNTNLIRIYIEEEDIEKAKLILHSLLNYLKEMFNQYSDGMMGRVTSQMKSKETEKLIHERKIDAYKNKINIIKQRKQEIEKDRSDIRKKIEKLKKEQDLILRKKDRSESFSSLIHLYSNEIQHNSINYSILNESLDNKKIEEEIIYFEIEDKERLIKKIEYEINDLQERINGIHYAQITKEPTSSISPVYPKKLTNVLIACILGLLISSMFSFFLEYIEKQKFKLKAKRSEQ